MKLRQLISATILYGALLGNDVTSRQVAADEKKDCFGFTESKKVASWEFFVETKEEQITDDTLKKFFNETIAKSFYEKFKDKENEFGGFLTKKKTDSGIELRLYAYDDPSDEPLRKAIDEVANGSYYDSGMIDAFVRMRKMAYDLEGFSTWNNLRAFFGLDKKPDFYKKWSERIEDTRLAKHKYDNEKAKEIRKAWTERHAPELKKEIVDLIYYSNTSLHEKHLAKNKEDICLEWHLHPLNSGPSMVDLLISNMKEDRMHMVLSAKEEKLSYWMYDDGEIKNNGVLYSAKEQARPGEK